MILSSCPTCGKRFGHHDDCTAVTHLHQGSQWPRNPTSGTCAPPHGRPQRSMPRTPSTSGCTRSKRATSPTRCAPGTSPSPAGSATRGRDHGVLARIARHRVQHHAPGRLADLDAERPRLPLPMGPTAATDRLRRRRHAYRAGPIGGPDPSHPDTPGAPANTGCAPSPVLSTRSTAAASATDPVAAAVLRPAPTRQARPIPKATGPHLPHSPARQRHRRVPRRRLRAARRTTGPAHRRAEPYPHHQPPKGEPHARPVNRRPAGARRPHRDRAGHRRRDPGEDRQVGPGHRQGGPGTGRRRTGH